MSSQEVSRMGWIALSASAVFGIIMYSPGATAAEEGGKPIIRVGTQPAEIIYAKITVGNLRRSYDFYTQVIGLKAIEMPGVPEPVLDNPDVKFTEVTLNNSGSPADALLVLVKAKGEIPSNESARLTKIGIKVTDVRVVLSRARAAGFSIDMDATPALGMVVGILKDPDGYVVQLHEAQSVTERAPPP